MIDEQGYRANVGIVISNQRGQLFWARRIGNPNAWQFPQGGVHEGEATEVALFRELHEETGLERTDVQILSCTDDWLRYKLPKHLIRYHAKPLCIGQKQIWYLLELVSDESKIRLDHSHSPEFDKWCWVDYWYPLKAVINFKFDVYQTVLQKFAPLIEPKFNQEPDTVK